MYLTRNDMSQELGHVCTHHIALSEEKINVSEQKKGGAIIATAQILEHLLNYRHQVIRG